MMKVPKYNHIMVIHIKYNVHPFHILTIDGPSQSKGNSSSISLGILMKLHVHHSSSYSVKFHGSIPSIRPILKHFDKL